jgi:hypothetical protein
MRAREFVADRRQDFGGALTTPAAFQLARAEQ